MGPTAIGKTAVSIQLAKKHSSEVISTDSVMVYNHFNIGSSKPTSVEMQGIKHHLIDILEPHQHYSVGQFSLDANKILSKGGNYILVGGTMMYAHHLIKHTNNQPLSHQTIRDELITQQHKYGINKLWEDLIKLDPRYKEIISPNDTQRIIRAIEVLKSTGKSLIDYWNNENKQSLDNYLVIKLVPKDRSHHKELIKSRLHQMIKQGFIEEVECIKKMKNSASFAGLKSIGYREISDHIDGKISKDEAIELANISTRQYAKRQLTWMRNQNYQYELLIECDTAKESNFLYINKELEKYFLKE